MLNKTPEIVIRHVTWVYVKYFERDGQSRLPESEEVSILFTEAIGRARVARRDAA